VIVVLDEAVPTAGLSCAGCGGWLRPWGFARVRSVRGRGRLRRQVRPAQAQWVRAEATGLAQLADPLLGAAQPTGSTLGDALDALGCAVAAIVRRLGPIARPWPLAAVIARGRLLAPLRN
jgi:hypothetical protein